MRPVRVQFLAWRGPVLLAGALLAAAHLGANTVTLQQEFRLDAANPASLLNFGAFDTGLGPLTGITFSLTATRRHEWGLWNISADNPAARSLHYTAGLTGSTLKLNGVSLAFADVTYGPSDTAPLAPVTDDELADDFFAGFGRFLSGQAADFALGANGVGLTNLTVSGTLPIDFSGNFWLAYDEGLAVALGYGPGTWNVDGAENAQGASLIDVFGQATIVYTYGAAPVPEHLSPMWLVTVLTGLGLLRRRMRRA